MLLLVSLLLGVAVARRRLGVVEWTECVPLGLVLGQLFLLVLTNATVRFLGWPVWSAVLWAGCFGLTLLVAYRPATPLPQAGRLPLAIVVLAGLSLLVACLWQALRVDDDYWIHAPIQGLLARGDFPPHNFFFPGVELKGHYGRDLLIVVWTRLTGLTTFSSQFLLTALLQPLQLLLIFWAFRRLSQPTSATWGTLFVALGVQVGGHCGLLVTFQNNNPVLHTWWALVLYAFAQTWRQRRLSWALLLGLTLGSLAIVYETHFGLACLASLITFAMGLIWLPDRSQFVRLGLVVLLTAAGLAFTQGGPLTDLAWRRIHPDSAGPPPSIGLSTQSQHISLRFPKEKLGQIRCQPAPNRWIDEISDKAWIYRLDQMADPKLGYAPFWDQAIRSLHSLPLYLSPLLLAWALKLRQPMALWLVTFGMLAFVTPALVDFGPVFESEYMRWEFAAGLGFAGALGLAVGPRIREDFLRRRPGAALWLLLLLYTTADLRSDFRAMSYAWETARLRGQPSWYWGAQDWITGHPVLDFAEADWQAAQWLLPRCRLGETVLVDPLARPHQVSYESTLCGLTGLKASRRIPLDTDAVGLVPARQRADVACFLRSGDPGYLDFTPAEWVLLRYPQPLPAHPEVDWTRLEERCVGHIRYTPPDWPTLLARPLDLEVRISGLPPCCDEGKIYPLVVHCSPPATPGKLVLGARPVGQQHSDPQDWVPFSLTQPGPLWMAPYRTGDYVMECFWWDQQGLHPLRGGAEFKVDTTGRLIQAALQSVRIEPTGKGDGWCLATVRFRAPLRDTSDYVGGATFLAGVSQGDPLQPLPNAQPLQMLQPLKIERVSPDLWEFRTRTLLPSDTGRFRLDLLLSPFHGTILRLRGPMVEVTPDFYPAP